jgi:hypothetical protein
MNWIDVKDQLPEEKKQILITDGEFVKLGYFSIWDNGYFWGAPPYLSQITHWMPLPELP